MVRSCHSAKLWAPLVLADFSGCGAFQRGAQHLAGLSPELAVSCSRSEVPALVLFEEKTITEVGRSTQNVKWNKFQEYLRNRAGGGGGECEEGRNEGRRLTGCKAWWQMCHSAPFCNHCLPLCTLSQLGAFLQDYGVVPLFVFQFPLIKRLCFYTSLSSSAL